MSIEIIKERENFFTKMTDKFADLKCHLYDIKFKFKNRFITKSFLIDTKLDKNVWHDTDYRMLYGNMQLLVEFVEKEKPFDIVDYDSCEYDRKVKETIIKIYTWWKNYPRRQNEISAILDRWCESRQKDCPIKNNNSVDAFIANLNCPSSIQTNQISKELDDAENKLLQEEDEMLNELITIRKSLWT